MIIRGISFVYYISIVQTVIDIVLCVLDLQL